MGFDPHEPEQRRRLRAALRAADISVSELWLKYFGMSGDAGEYEVEAYLQGLLSLPPIQRDLLALAANELIDERPRPRAPYSNDFTSRPEAAEEDAGGDAEGDDDGGSEPGAAAPSP
ncbi:hypothetical protein FB478_102404 [Arthrobacter sp. AG367]|uniref:hypothetical protein n=1 Tax=Arthrobacter sp. AG367 TaxID=2572909 RepID=UPI00119FD437|nr:hypothetical protein [Arthrobacter sp. AG367]TWD55061.1 hypothetical protein FB478_102404 [Arthrobacter sp. AG367]